MKSVDLTSRSVFKTLLLFSLPLIANNLVQLLFHVADVAVLAVMTDDAAVAAVGACGPIINVLLSLFSGLTAGANIIVARYVGAKKEEDARRATGTALTASLVCGFVLLALAEIFAEKFLLAVNCQSDVLANAALYMRLYFLGIPIILLYNTISALFRAIGDNVRSMAYIMTAGVLNVVLNIFFVGVLHLTVAGVALATVLSNAVALILALISLFKNKDYCKVEKRNLRIRKKELFMIFGIGIPASLGSLCFYVSNIFVASAVNALSTAAMTANTISAQFDGVVYSVGLSVATSCSSMVGQAMGAKKLKRLTGTIRTASLYACALSLTLGTVFVLFSTPLLGLLTDDPTVLAIAKEKLTVLCFTYFITSLMEVFSFSLRPMGLSHSVTAVCFVCGLCIRSLWVVLAVPFHNTLGMIYLSYPVSALCALLIYLVLFWKRRKRLGVEFAEKERAEMLAKV